VDTPISTSSVAVVVYAFSERQIRRPFHKKDVCPAVRRFFWCVGVDNRRAGPCDFLVLARRARCGVVQAHVPSEQALTIF